MKVSTHLLVDQQAGLLDPLGDTLTHNLDSLVTRDVLVMLALLSLGRGSPDWLLELLRLLKTLGHRHAVDSAVLLVLGPSRAGDVAADDGLERHDLVAADLHAALVELRAGFRGNVGGEVRAEEVGLERGHPCGDEVEPVGGELCEESTFGGDTLRLIVSIYELSLAPGIN
jgi:hypothetical protein